MQIFSRKPAPVPIGPGPPKANGNYQEFLFGLNFLLGEKWSEKNPFREEFSSSRCDPNITDDRPIKQFQTIETSNRERMLSAIHQKEMTKWQTHP
jgi:hypothetical protein